LNSQTTGDDRPARFLWLPPGLRPPVSMSVGQERTLMLVGVAALFAGYDTAIFGLAIPQIQASLGIPEDRVALTVSFFRLASFAAIFLAASADLVGRRRLLLFTIVGQTIATVMTAFSQTYEQFVVLQVITRIFGYAEEMLCLVVIMEEISAKARGWAAGTFGAMSSTGAGIASLVFALVNLLPFGWRAIYVIGAVPLLLVAYLRRRLPETQRFIVREQVIHDMSSRTAQALALVRLLLREYPARIVTLLVAVAALGFAFSPAVVLMSKYLQEVHHYAPGNVTLLYVPGGFIALFLSIIAGRASDRIGRRVVVMTTSIAGALCFGLFYSGLSGWFVPVAWIAAMFGYFTADALLAGLANELVPTAYRATVSGLRYTVQILIGAISLALEGVFYNLLGSHAAAVLAALSVVVVVPFAIFFLPEPSGKTLEEMAPEPVV